MEDGQVQGYRAGAVKGAHWLLQQQNQDGSFSSIEEGVDAYYKIPYALAVTGYSCQAHRLLDWALAQALTPEGDLRGAEVKGQNPWHSETYTYSNSWMVIGAQRLGRFDYAYPGMAYILQFISTANGGVFSEPDFILAGKGRQDMVSSSQAGSACLYMGELNAARRIGDWFVEMLHLQPDLEHALYACSDPSIGVITDYPSDYSEYYVVKTDESGQWYFYPGIAVGFLAKLYLAAGREAYLDAAEAYFDFTARCAEDVYTTGPSGKVGWGSSQMYWITGDEKYSQAAVAVADFLLETQSETGCWKLPDPDGNPPPPRIQLDHTAEFVVWLAEIAQHLDG